MVAVIGTLVPILLAVVGFGFLARFLPPDTGARLSGLGIGISEIIGAPITATAVGLGRLGVGLELLSGPLEKLLGTLREFFSWIADLSGDFQGLNVTDDQMQAGRTLSTVTNVDFSGIDLRSLLAL